MSDPQGRPSNASSEVTQLLGAWRDGDRGAFDRLMPLVYGELHRLAEGYLRRERPAHTLQATAVIHEAYLRLVDSEPHKFDGRLHFFAAAARLMRRILVDHARARRAAKRGGEAVRVPLDEELDGAEGEAHPADLLAVDEALYRLAEVDQRKAQVMELRYFGGLTLKETASFLGVSQDTVILDTRMARAWLRRALRDDQS